MKNAWAFTLDGHVFYVLSDVGGETLVYDVRTGHWHHWYTGAATLWNMYRGVMWRGEVIAADASLGKIWTVDPYSMLDEEATQIQRVVTGFMPFRGRRSVRQGSLRLTVSLGYPTADPATVAMRFSDDEEESWSILHSRILVAEDFDQVLRFRSLGRIRAPGRVWEITDTGGFVRIEGADADVEGA